MGGPCKRGMSIVCFSFPLSWPYWRPQVHCDVFNQRIWKISRPHRPLGAWLWCVREPSEHTVLFWLWISSAQCNHYSSKSEIIWRNQLSTHAPHPQLNASWSILLLYELHFSTFFHTESKVSRRSKSARKAAQLISNSSEHSVFLTRLSSLQKLPWWPALWCKDNVILFCPPQFLNFALVPLYARTTFTGCCAFVWAIFLCFSQQSGDGTVGAALEWMFPPKRDEAETGETDSSEQRGAPRNWSALTQMSWSRCLFAAVEFQINLASAWLRQVLRKTTSYFNTSLRERTAAMVTGCRCSRLPSLTHSTGTCKRFWERPGAAVPSVLI